MTVQNKTEYLLSLSMTLKSETEEFSKEDLINALEKRLETLKTYPESELREAFYIEDILED